MKYWALFYPLAIGYGAIAKITHLPLANYFLIFSVPVFALPFLILTGIQLYLEKKPKFPFVILAVLPIMVYVIGTLFLIMHWAVAYFLMLAGLFTSLIILLLFNIVELLTKQENRKFAPLAISFVMIGMSLLAAASFRSSTRGTIISMVLANYALNHSLHTTELMITHEGGIGDTTATATLRKSADSTAVAFARERDQLLALIGSPAEIVYGETPMLENVDLPERILLNRGHAKELKDLLDDYSNFLASNSGTYGLTNTDLEVLSTSRPRNVSEATGWIEAKFYGVPLIGAVSNLTEMELAVRECELKALVNMHQGLRI